MRKYLLILTLVAFRSHAQDKPVPAYMADRVFPDSVMSLQVDLADGTTSTLGKVIEQLRGKKIVIDIWASWCRDCIVGLPKLDALRNQTKPENVAYLMLSVDKDPAKWKGAISRFAMKGEHYRIQSGWENPLGNYIVLDWVPRYITLDGAGKVIMPKAIVADDKVLIQSITE